MLFIAEIGLNHNGNFGLIPELVRQASRVKADIAKFQLGWRDGPDEINQITPSDIQDIVNICEYYEIEPMFSLITREAYEMAKSFNFNRYKIASRTVIDNPNLCEKIISEGKEVFCSLGFWDKEDFPFGPPNEKLHYIFCVSNYPTFPSDLIDFPEKFNNSGYFGYSDHCLGISACLLAISKGAQFIEKHFTLNKTSQVIRDHVLSSTPDEFKVLTSVGSELNRFYQAIN